MADFPSYVKPENIEKVDKPTPANYTPALPEYPKAVPFQPVYGRYDLTTYIQGMSDYEIMCYLVAQYNIVAGGFEQAKGWSEQLNTAYGQLQEWCNRFSETVTNDINDERTWLNDFSDNISANYNQLINWVNEWFDNLDVQDEINNKLDNLVADGTLASIINQEVFASIEPLVSVKKFKTDDNTWEDAIEAACASITQPNIYTIVMPTGSYTISRTVSISGNADRVLFYGSTFTPSSSLSDGLLFNVSLTGTVEGLTITGSSEDSNTAIYHASYNAKLINCNITSMHTAVHIKGSVACEYEKIYAYNCDVGVLIEPISLSPFRINTCLTFLYCLFHSCGDAIKTQNYSAALPACAKTKFSGCVFEANTNVNANAPRLLNLEFDCCWFEANTNKTIASSALFCNCNIQNSDAGLAWNEPGYNRNVIIGGSNILTGELRLQSYSGGDDANSYIPLRTSAFSNDNYKLHASIGSEPIVTIRTPSNGSNYYSLFYIGLNTKQDETVAVLSNISDYLSVTRESLGVYNIASTNNYLYLFPLGAMAGGIGATQTGYNVKLAPFFQDAATYRDYMSCNAIKVFVTDDAGSPVDGKVWIGGMCNIKST